VAEYIGSRRSAAPSSGAAQRASAEDDAALTCPKCGAAVREAQAWCSLCLHVLHTPQPAAPAPQPAAGVVAVPGSTGEAAVDVEAAADALLAQLAVETRRDGLQVPAVLNSRARIAVFVTVAMSVLCGACLVAMGVLGAVFG
jgi:hypothetical protein